MEVDATGFNLNYSQASCTPARLPAGWTIFHGRFLN